MQRKIGKTAKHITTEALCLTLIRVVSQFLGKMCVLFLWYKIEELSFPKKIKKDLFRKHLLTSGQPELKYAAARFRTKEPCPSKQVC